LFKRIIHIAGAPRSGTSWLGQIIDSHPYVGFRFQPLFSWAFKGIVGYQSSRDDFLKFFEDIYNSDDSFLLQSQRRNEGIYPIFQNKSKSPEILALKMIRYHFLLPKMLEHFNNIFKVICIIRHPCGAINSWLNTAKEFPAGADPLKEWKAANIRNKDHSEEYWGFDGWCRSTKIFSAISKQYKVNVYILIYEKLVSETTREVKKLFEFLNLDMDKQTKDFLTYCHKNNSNDPYSVFKSKKVKDKWKDELNVQIQNEIIAETKQKFPTLLKEFI
jgi:hypothetical protein